MDNVDLFGIRVASGTKREIVAAIIGLSRKGGRPAAAFYLNAHCVNIACADRAYKDILNSADLVYTGGTGLVWASRFLGKAVGERANILDCFDLIKDEAKRHGLRFFLLGDRPEIVEKAAAALRSMGLTVAGYHHGYDTDDAGVVARINACAPDILMVGMGVPRQEKWIAGHRAALKAGLCWGVGGVFKLFAGTLRRAPQWMIDCGLEWLFLGLQDPGRLLGRYLFGNPLFVLRVLGEKMRISPIFSRRFCAAALLLLALGSLALIFSSRAWSHLACWRISAESSPSAVYRPPAGLAWLRLENRADVPGLFAGPDERAAAAGETMTAVGRMVARVDRIFDAGYALPETGRLRWDAPEGLARQIAAGRRGGHCFHRAILLAEYCAAADIPVRLWALENSDFDRVAHTIVEFYDRQREAWIFCDPTYGVYAIAGGTHLSFVALRAALLEGAPQVSFVSLRDDPGRDLSWLAGQYRLMMPLAFLRGGNDFTAAYDRRYGCLNPARLWIDRCPDAVRLGIQYLCGPGELFVQCADGHARPRSGEAVAAKRLVWALVMTALVSVFFLLYPGRTGRHR